MNMNIRHLHYFAGEPREPASGVFLNKFNPRTGAKIGEVAQGSQADVDAAVVAARAAFGEWRDRKPIERGRLLIAIARQMRAQAKILGNVEGLEAGKPDWQLPIEIEGAA